VAFFYENIAIINDTSRVTRMMIVSDGPSCGVTCDHQYDKSRGVFYAARVVNYAPNKHL
jgi:hypothetical protein